MASENTPLLPEPTPSSPRRSGRRTSLSNWPVPFLNRNGSSSGDAAPKQTEQRRTYALYALLLILGVGVGVGGTLLIEHPPKTRPPMVPPVYSLPPPTGLPRNPAYLMGPGKAAVASEDITCSDLGLAILRDKNGTAVDAAITSTLCVGLLNGFSAGIGGGGFALVSIPPATADDDAESPAHGDPEDEYAFDVKDHENAEDDGGVLFQNGATAAAAGKNKPKPPAGPNVMAIDFRETSPAASTAKMYKKDRGASQVGGLAVGVPGELRGLEAAHKLYGKVPWAELVQPVADLARQWQVSRELARRIRIFGTFMLDDPVWAEVYAPKGTLLVEGDWISRHKYADTLEVIAREGPGALYTGAIADDIVNTVQADGGVLTHDDLEGYRARVYPAISGKFQGSTVYSIDAPAAGGVMIGMLQILDPLMKKQSCGSVDNTHHIIEAMKFAFGGRSEITDPAFAKNVTRLADFYSQEWADEKRALITNGTHKPAYYGLETDAPEDHGTTHTSVVDQWCGAASVTSTVNLIWGSHVMTPKTGIILNDEQDDFAVPGTPDAFGLPPSPHNYPAPGKRPLSSTAPTIVHERDGSLRAVLGGSGGSRIFPSVAQVLINLACGDDLSTAIERPRVHNQIVPDLTTLEVGPDHVSQHWLDGLAARGHTIGQFDINLGSSEVQAVVVEGGQVWASSDSRKNGIAAAY